MFKWPTITDVTIYFLYRLLRKIRQELPKLIKFWNYLEIVCKFI